MQSSNPVFRRSDTFNGRGGSAYSSYGSPTRTAPSSWSVGAPGQPPQQPGQQAPIGSARISIDSVVQKTGITLGLLVVSAAVTWFLVGDITSADTEVADSALARASTFALLGVFGGFGLSMVNSFKRVVSPPLVLAYSVLQGMAIGAISLIFETMYPGIVMGAVLGTTAAFAGTLTAYKVLNIQVTAKFRRGVIAAMFGFVAVTMLDFVLSFFGAAIGFNGFGPLGLIMSILGVVLGVFMLILDFDYVEKAIAAGAPERESWRAAFGLTVTIVWLYVEILRILAILRGD
ncbi:MAG: Bax inhibitor-1/YccA family protein [Nocardioidaceae bacterium]|nr:Bax inhibitor-1/YccA family protein [Nocardioidaceae bacterium]